DQRIVSAVHVGPVFRGGIARHAFAHNGEQGLLRGVRVHLPKGGCVSRRIGGVAAQARKKRQALRQGGGIGLLRENYLGPQETGGNGGQQNWTTTPLATRGVMRRDHENRVPFSSDFPGGRGPPKLYTPR